VPNRIYFQWQNPFLRRTIYPLREMKLRDFLIFYHEIELWEQFKPLSLDSLQQEIAQYALFQAQLRRERCQQYLELCSCFLNPDLSALIQQDFPQPDPAALAYLTSQHSAFRQHFLSYNRTDRERAFLENRIRDVENFIQRVHKELADIKRNLVNMGEGWTHRPQKLQRQTQIEQVALPMLDAEHQRLKEFSAVMAFIQPLRDQLLAWRREQAKQIDSLTSRLSFITTSLASARLRHDTQPSPALAGQISSLAEELAALQEKVSFINNSLLEPECEQIEKIAVFPQPTKADLVRGRVDAYRADLVKKDHTALLELVVQRFLANPKDYPLWLQYMVIHFSGMRYQSAHGSWADPREMLSALSEMTLERDLQSAADTAVESLCREKIRLYEDVIALGADPGAEAPLLARLAFSGSGRWKTAARDLHRRLKQYSLRLRCTPSVGSSTTPLYRESAGKMVDSGRALRRNAEVITEPLPLLNEGEYYRITLFPENQQIAGHFIAAQNAVLVPNPHKRKALLDLLAAEETCRIEEELDDADVLAGLQSLKDELGLPAWMWHEIVRLTGLRLKTSEPDWETRPLTQQEREQIYSPRFRVYANLLNRWKQTHLTGWRAEHDRSSRLVVTRAVCNEVGEHILHLRGLTPPGGLTAKPIWYRRKEKAASQPGSAGSPYFVRADSPEHFKPGASLFWLRFVPNTPSPWQVAHPLELKDGSGLLPSTLAVRLSDPPSGTRPDWSKNFFIKTSGPWRYYQLPDGRFKRSRTIETHDGQTYVDDNCLRWMHEAAVIKTAETADGPVVLTFETALPFEDRRRSTIGVFKHDMADLRYSLTAHSFTGTFLGYHPDGPLPLADLQEMLDWNKILLRPGFLSPHQKEQYWKAALGESTSLPTQPADLERMEVSHPPGASFGQHRESILCYDVDPHTLRAVPYLPAQESLRVELPRGARLCVDLSRAVVSTSDTYLPVHSCEDVPLAQDHYVSAQAVVPAPQSPPDRPLRIASETELFALSHSGESGAPVFRPLPGARLPEGMSVMASSAQRVGTPGPEPGSITGSDGRIYALVIECPLQPEAAGSFVCLEDAVSITSEEYFLSILHADGSAKAKIRVRLPAQAGFQIYRKSGSGFIPFRQIPLPEPVLAWTSPLPEFSPGGEYYCILDLPGHPDLTGRYLRVEDSLPE
jgi:hypothetical protein